MVKRCLLVLALVAAHCTTTSARATAGAGAPDADSTKISSRQAAEKFSVWKARAARVLIARGDANSLATAAALTYVGSSLKTDPAKSAAAALDLAAQAGELAPQNAAIGWLHLRLCAETAACDIRDVATVMRWVDADNGAAWLPTFAAAQKDKDRIEVDRVLADMSRGSRFDLYFNRVVVLMFDALSRARNELPRGYAASDAARLATLSGIAAAELVPAFAPLLEACRESVVSERRELCLKLSKTMQRSDTIVAQMMGFNIEKRLLAPDGKEARMLADRRHVLEWRLAAAAAFDTSLLPWTKNSRARARLALMRAKPREEDVCLAILREHKMAVDPPEVHP